jgi:hypothetical protein
MSLACGRLVGVPPASDIEILSVLSHDRPEFGWSEWFGDVDAADYLTSGGKPR